MAEREVREIELHGDQGPSLRFAGLPHNRAAMNWRPAHSITSSAVASSVGGTSRPSALAVLRWMTNSNLVGCTTGRSAGFSPLRILPV
jgi:hypothetical protein